MGESPSKRVPEKFESVRVEDQHKTGRLTRNGLSGIAGRLLSMMYSDTTEEVQLDLSEISQEAQLDEILSECMLHLTKDDLSHCNAIPLKSKFLLIPNHFIENATQMVTVMKVGGYTSENVPLDRTCTYRIPKTDLAVWYAPRVGNHRDIVEYYPKEFCSGKQLTVYTLFNNRGKLIRYPDMIADMKPVATTQGGRFLGFKYIFPANTFGGLCMATLVGEANGAPFIAGHHLAGILRVGAAGLVTSSAILLAIDELTARLCL